MVIEIMRNDWNFPIEEQGHENIYLRGIHNGKAYANCQLQFVGSTACIHLYIDKMGPGCLREMLNDLTFIKKLVISKGADKIFGCHGVEGSEKWAKFLRLVGFSEPRDIEFQCKPYKITELEVDNG